MGLNEFILFAAVAVGLGVWGLAQAVMALLNRDRRRLQNRLASEWRSDFDDLLKKSVTVEAHGRGLPKALADVVFLQRLNQKLRYAYPEAKVSMFLAIGVFVASMSFVIATCVMDSLLAGLVGGAAGAYLPLLWINNRRTRRQRMISRQLPDALEFLSRVLRAGHSLSTGIQMLGDEMPSPIADEFRRCYDQHSLGQSLEQAMREMAGRIDCSDFAFFVTAVLIQRQTGGDLTEVLTNISTMVRSRFRLMEHVKAITAEGRLTGYILVAFPAVMFAISYVLNPQYAGVLLRTDIGRILLGATVGLQMLGLLAIRKIVAVKV